MMRLASKILFRGDLVIKRLYINKDYIWRIAQKFVGRSSSGIAFISIIAPENVFLAPSTSLQDRIFIAIIGMATLVVAGIIYGAYKTLRTNRCKVVALQGQHYLYVQYGDVFSKDEVFLGEAHRRNIVIPVNRCFDTMVNDDLVSSRTLHGIAIKTILKNEMYTRGQLNREIESDLKRQKKTYTKIEKTEKISIFLAEVHQ